MIHVTERAREQFGRTLATISHPTSNRRLRLAPTASGLGVFADTGQDETDQVVEHGGVPVLLISSKVCRILDGRTIDYTDSEEGARFVRR